MRLPSFRRVVLPLVAVTIASGCAFIIPDNPSDPRYNTVLGERRMPEQNKSMGSGGGATSAPVPAVQQQALPPQSSMNLPPVDDATRRIAEQRMGRAIPAENSSYPVLSEMPPAPITTGDDAATARLAKVRAALEQDRAAANAAKTRLVTDAAAEPSMLSELPPTNGVVPPPMPVHSAPVPPPAGPAPMVSAPMAMQPVNVPPAAHVRSIADLPPPPPVYASAPAAMAPAPMATPSIAAPTMPPTAAPIMMDRVPMGGAPAPMMAAPAPQMAGSFDPMAGAPPIVLTPPPGMMGSGSYLPSSRYSYRR